MSAVILEDIVKTIQPSITEERQTVVSKIIGDPFLYQDPITDGSIFSNDK